MISRAAPREAGTAAVMRSPRSVDVEITSRCNLRCRYCYYFGNDEVAYRDLTTAEWLDFFAELGHEAVMDVVLCGGEPFIREDLKEIIAGIVANRMRFTILSNGTLVDSGIARFIAATGRCTNVQVSIDGATAEVHDSFRGHGSFAKAVAGIEALQGAGVPVTSRLTVHRRNIDKIGDAVRFLLDDLGLETVGTNAASRLGVCRLEGGDVELTVAEYGRAMKTLLGLSDEYPGRITASAGPLATALSWREMEEQRREGAAPSPEGGRLTGCRCPTSRLAVRADGTWTPCALLPAMALGRINTDSLREIWSGNSSLAAMRRRPAIELSNFEECTDCPYVGWCTGNCAALALSLTGELDRPSPDACLKKYLAAGGKLP